MFLNIHECMNNTEGLLKTDPQVLLPEILILEWDPTSNILIKYSGDFRIHTLLKILVIVITRFSLYLCVQDLVYHVITVVA